MKLYKTNLFPKSKYNDEINVYQIPVKSDNEYFILSTQDFKKWEIAFSISENEYHYFLGRIAEQNGIPLTDEQIEEMRNEIKLKYNKK
jgi:hypothetical protein